MITADQIVAHLVGDYILQSDWQANEKTKHSLAAAVHALLYGLCFLVFRPSVTAFVVIVASHFAIDRWRLARYLVYAKNFLAPPQTPEITYVESGCTPAGVPIFTEHAKVARWWHPWSDCSGTGYHKKRPPWMAVWLLIIADNTCHIICNALALRYL